MCYGGIFFDDRYWDQYRYQKHQYRYQDQYPPIPYMDLIYYGIQGGQYLQKHDRDSMLRAVFGRIRGCFPLCTHHMLTKTHRIYRKDRFISTAVAKPRTSAKTERVAESDYYITKITGRMEK